VSEYDCLLLEHVLWQEPEHAAKISDWLLAQLAVDDGMKQVRWEGTSGVVADALTVTLTVAVTLTVCLSGSCVYGIALSM
jgi:hypothetical protein